MRTQIQSQIFFFVEQLLVFIFLSLHYLGSAVPLVDQEEQGHINNDF